MVEDGVLGTNGRPGFVVLPNGDDDQVIKGRNSAKFGGKTKNGWTARNVPFCRFFGYAKRVKGFGL